MKRVLSVLLTLLLLAAMGWGGYQYLVCSPRGVFLNMPPESMVEELLSSRTEEEWIAVLAPLWTGEVTEFEDRDELCSLLFDAAVSGAEWRFAEAEELSSRTEAVYDVYAGERPAARLTLRWQDGQWVLTDTALREELLRCETYTVSITLPSGCVPTVNGREVGEACLAETDIPYEDMRELERRFTEVPALSRYEVSGLYLAAEVNAPGQVPVSRQGDSYVFEPADARSYSFRLLAPESASVTVSGALLSPSEAVGSELMSTDVTVPEELRQYLPKSLLFECDGLYTAPELTVTDRDGTLLTGTVRDDGVVCYSRTRETAPEEALSKTVRDYMTTACRFGVAQAYTDHIYAYVPWNGELGKWYQLAAPSLGWVLGTGLKIHEIIDDSYFPLGEDACLCRVRCLCATTNYFGTDELDFSYQLLCQRAQDGWKITDMAYE